jgi:hypothetical protein
MGGCLVTVEVALERETPLHLPPKAATRSPCGSRPVRTSTGKPASGECGSRFSYASQGIRPSRKT